MIIHLVWISYEDVDAAFYKLEDAEKYITDYINQNPTYGGYRTRERSDFGVTEIEVK